WHALGRVLHAGAGSGTALKLSEPLSFWGGVDPETGAIIDSRHPQTGSLAGRILVMPSGRGSSSSSSVLAECLRNGTGPAAILLLEPDEIIIVGALVVEMLGGRQMPVVQLDGSSYEKLRSGDIVRVSDSGEVTVEGSAP
ncbi:MAG TPA: DUF126 domain-containing protein, partial [Candidatus Limnocylindrales bacterium]